MTECVPIRIGIVDDHTLFRQGLGQLLLKRNERQVAISFEASNGKEAVSLYSENGADVVLMDVQMPEMDGVTATKKILQTHTEAGIIALSSFCEASSVREMVRAGARGYLLKNTSQQELNSALVTVANGGTYFASPVISFAKEAVASLPVDGAGALTAREEAVLRMLCKGKTNQEVATEMFISKRTVDGHREKIMKKLGARHWMDVFAYGYRKGIISL